MKTPTHKQQEDSWREALKEFAIINEMYIRGFPMGKLEALISSLLLSNEAKARKECGEETLDELWPIYEAINEFYSKHIGSKDPLDASSDFAQITAMFNGSFKRLKLPLDPPESAASAITNKQN